jgi:NTP pyrophosphatase (non-canonical NTP hydrolase)
MKTFNELEISVRNWAIEKGIDKPENAPKQMLKVMEEVGETAGALLKNNEAELKDGIGDSFVTLIIQLTECSLKKKIYKNGKNKLRSRFRLGT